MDRVSINIKLFVSHLIDSYIYVRNIEPSDYRPITVPPATLAYALFAADRPMHY